MAKAHTFYSSTLVKLMQLLYSSNRKKVQANECIQILEVKSIPLKDLVLI